MAQGRRKVVVALRGGPDSVALLAKAVERHGRPNTRAVVVDHAITSSSSSVAERVAHTARSLLGVHAHTVCSPARTMSQASARSARWAALWSSLGPGESLLVGSHADDAAELLIMRLLRGSTLRGLGVLDACLQPPRFGRGPSVSDVDVQRPLQLERKETLRQLCHLRNLPFIEDPANVNSKYARSHARAALARGSTAGGLDVDDALRVASASTELRQQIDSRTNTLALRSVVYRKWEPESWALLTLDWSFFLGEPDAVVEHAADLIAQHALLLKRGKHSSEIINPARRRGKQLAAEVLQGRRKAALVRRCKFQLEDAYNVVVEA